MRKCIVVLISLLLLAGCGAGANQFEEYSFTNQDNETFELESLKGNVWVADFIFTNCDTVCPPMTAHMAKLQQKAKEQEVDVQFISFSVDPEVDSPAVLKEFAEKFDVDHANWSFLTGYSQEEIGKFANEHFKTIAQKPKGEDQVIHQSYFYLVDQDGNVVNQYGGYSDTPYDEIIEDLKELQ
ncbi:SCO family protein [Bacillus carboniphilus]|uniref:SCO family protein n=1 Tax=Bacillus carboniphilus TaxID=86663 RepID=A0ABY9K1F0_9BACI|nr:SCO family protein [Bacillus carboniphilus]WLR43670.1 SCO family protein [Bacillus carboniphilus]